MKDTTQIYTFSHHDAYSGVSTSLTFTCPSDVTVDTFAYMSSRAAAAFSYTDHDIDCFHYSDDIFAEFDEDCDCEGCCCEH